MMKMPLPSIVFMSFWRTIMTSQGQIMTSWDRMMSVFSGMGIFHFWKFEVIILFKLWHSVLNYDFTGSHKNSTRGHKGIFVLKFVVHFFFTRAVDKELLLYQFMSMQVVCHSYIIVEWKGIPLHEALAIAWFVEGQMYTALPPPKKRLFLRF